MDVEAALNEGPAAILILSADGRTVQWFNQPAEALFELDAPQARASGAWPGSDGCVPPGWTPLCQALQRLTGPSPQPEGVPPSNPEAGRTATVVWPRLSHGQPQTWQVMIRADADRLLLTALDVSAIQAHQTLQLQAAHQQRDVLLREVHHRLKNNLQGVGGLLQLWAQSHEAAAPWLRQAAQQIQALSRVYGLQESAQQGPDWVDLVRAIAQDLQSIFVCTIRIEPSEVDAGNAQAGLPPAAWALHPDQATAVALILNELLTNAIKHGQRQEGSPLAAVQCTLSADAQGCAVEITQPGQLPPDFDQRSGEPGIRGLGLVRALLPRRGAELQWSQNAGLVCARLQIRPPVVLQRDAPAPQSTAT